MDDQSDNRGDNYLLLGDEVLVRQCDVDRYRGPGPGGQKRNKTSSAVRLRHRPTGIAVIATEDRSQHVNKIRAIRRLREAIALRIRNPIDAPNYEPSELLANCIGSDNQIQIGRRDERFWLVVREILDVLFSCQMHVSEAADRLGISTAHLVKFIESNSKLWERVNQLRETAGLKPLR
ncbi:MAG: peptide chain release factor-like protein [Planctomycetes bacterium]|nr:peptide chain release factor-like protein [Planctomycetota bacterium]